MVRSMTGYGRAKQERNGRSITVEVRSVNNRYLDCTVKMPRAYIFAEDAMKALVQKSISRGKVDVFVTMDAVEAAVACNFLECRNVAPMHWGTFPVLAQETDAFEAALREYAPETSLVRIAPGQTVELG